MMGPASGCGAYPNHVWNCDFTQDRTHNGSPFRILNVIDE